MICHLIIEDLSGRSYPWSVGSDETVQSGGNIIGLMEKLFPLASELIIERQGSLRIQDTCNPLMRRYLGRSDSAVSRGLVWPGRFGRTWQGSSRIQLLIKDLRQQSVTSRGKISLIWCEELIFLGLLLE